MSSSTVMVRSHGWSGPLLEGLDHLRHIPALCDLTIVTINGHVMMAHACVLAAASTYVRATLLRSTARYPAITLSISDDTWYTVLRFVYTGEARVSPDRLDSLLRAASKLGIQHLVRVCKHAILAARKSAAEKKANESTTKKKETQAESLPDEHPCQEDDTNNSTQQNESQQKTESETQPDIDDNKQDNANDEHHTVCQDDVNEDTKEQVAEENMDVKGVNASEQDGTEGDMDGAEDETDGNDATSNKQNGTEAGGSEYEMDVNDSITNDGDHVEETTTRELQEHEVSEDIDTAAKDHSTSHQSTSDMKSNKTNDRHKPTCHSRDGMSSSHRASSGPRMSSDDRTSHRHDNSRPLGRSRSLTTGYHHGYQSHKRKLDDADPNQHERKHRGGSLVEKPTHKDWLFDY